MLLDVCFTRQLNSKVRAKIKFMARTDKMSAIADTIFLYTSKHWQEWQKGHMS